MKQYVTHGTGSSQTLSEVQNTKVVVYDTKADAEADLSNLTEGQLVATPDTGDELAQPVNEVALNNLHSVTSNAVAVVQANLQSSFNYRLPRVGYGRVDWNNYAYTFDLSDYIDANGYRPWHISIEYSTGTDFGLIIGLVSNTIIKISTVFGISGYSCTASISNKILTVNFNTQISACSVYVTRYYN